MLFRGDTKFVGKSSRFYGIHIAEIWFTLKVILCTQFYAKKRSYKDQNGPYINTFQTNLRN